MAAVASLELALEAASKELDESRGQCHGSLSLARWHHRVVDRAQGRCGNCHGACTCLVSASTPFLLPQRTSCITSSPISLHVLYSTPLSSLPFTIILRYAAYSLKDIPPPLVMRSPIPTVSGPKLPEPAKLINDDKAFENTSTSVAASQMRNALNNLADTVTDPEQKKVRSITALS
jgi:hypothetical protein